MPDSELSSTGRFRRKDSRRTGEDGHSVQRDHSDSEEKLLSGSNAVVLQSKALETLAFSSTRAHEPPTKPRATRLASPPGESGTDIARSAHSVHDISLMGDERLGSMSTGGAQKVGGGWGGPSREDTGAGTGIMTEVSWGKRVARGWGENSSAVWDRHADNGWGQFQRHAGSDASFPFDPTAAWDVHGDYFSLPPDNSYLNVSEDSSDLRPASSFLAPARAFRGQYAQYTVSLASKESSAPSVTRAIDPRDNDLQHQHSAKGPLKRPLILDEDLSLLDGKELMDRMLWYVPSVSHTFLTTARAPIYTDPEEGVKALSLGAGRLESLNILNEERKPLDSRRWNTAFSPSQKAERAAHLKMTGEQERGHGDERKREKEEKRERRRAQRSRTQIHDNSNRDLEDGEIEVTSPSSPDEFSSPPSPSSSNPDFEILGVVAHQLPTSSSELVNGIFAAQDAIDDQGVILDDEGQVPRWTVPRIQDSVKVLQTDLRGSRKDVAELPTKVIAREEEIQHAQQMLFELEMEREVLITELEEARREILEMGEGLARIQGQAVRLSDCTVTASAYKLADGHLTQLKPIFKQLEGDAANRAREEMKRACTRTWRELQESMRIGEGLGAWVEELKSGTGDQAIRARPSGWGSLVAMGSGSLAANECSRHKLASSMNAIICRQPGHESHTCLYMLPAGQFVSIPPFSPPRSLLTSWIEHNTMGLEIPEITLDDYPLKEFSLRQKQAFKESRSSWAAASIRFRADPTQELAEGTRPTPLGFSKFCETWFEQNAPALLRGRQSLQKSYLGRIRAACATRSREMPLRGDADCSITIPQRVPTSRSISYVGQRRSSSGRFVASSPTPSSSSGASEAVSASAISAAASSSTARSGANQSPSLRARTAIDGSSGSNGTRSRPSERVNATPGPSRRQPLTEKTNHPGSLIINSESTNSSKPQSNQPNRRSSRNASSAGDGEASHPQSNDVQLAHARLSVSIGARAPTKAESQYFRTIRCDSCSDRYRGALRMAPGPARTEKLANAKCTPGSGLEGQSFRCKPCITGKKYCSHLVWLAADQKLPSVSEWLDEGWDVPPVYMKGKGKGKARPERRIPTATSSMRGSTKRTALLAATPPRCRARRVQRKLIRRWRLTMLSRSSISWKGIWMNQMLGPTRVHRCLASLRVHLLLLIDIFMVIDSFTQFQA
ncbi:hypothetical protein BDV98DRAFT_627225 [Pterulicium gracile]|uniref:Uncharacterized protein n=1 Tax=Pterulicium gracile TaxID=1884261 RepID=A0A5C3QA62_9AGAR|nr:hypothetical protein BDV98DRAFT_627225 [Pterula gracilis]